MNLEEQHAMIRELELPVAALVSSGGKSLHAIVRIEAGSFEEYRSRVDYLYAVCEKNGLKVDRQNRNPSRLSRLPGVMRRRRARAFWLRRWPDATPLSWEKPSTPRSRRPMMRECRPSRTRQALKRPKTRSQMR